LALKPAEIATRVWAIDRGSREREGTESMAAHRSRRRIDELARRLRRIRCLRRPLRFQTRGPVDAGSCLPGERRPVGAPSVGQCLADRIPGVPRSLPWRRALHRTHSTRRGTPLVVSLQADSRRVGSAQFARIPGTSTAAPCPTIVKAQFGEERRDGAWSEEVIPILFVYGRELTPSRWSR
jgi:hypothetical protein